MGRLRVRVSIVFMLLLAAGSVSTAYAERVTVGRAKIHPETPERVEAVSRLFSRVSTLANRRYGDLFSVAYGSEGGDYHVEILVTFSATGTIGTLSMSEPGTPTEHTFPILGIDGEDMVGYYASGIASLWNAFTDGFSVADAEPPRYLDELPTEIIAPLLTPANPAMSVSILPMSGTTLSDGSLVVAMSIAAARLDPWFRLIGRPASDQVEANNYNLAGRVFSTPADTLFLFPNSGTTYYRVTDGVPGSMTGRVGADISATPVTVLADGSIVQKSISGSDVQRYQGRNRTGFSLASGPMSYVTLIATGPDGNLWSWDQVERRVKIFSPDGVLLDSVVAIHRADSFLSPQALVPAPDGGFLLVVQGVQGPEIMRFRRDGRPEWVLSQIENDFPEPLPYNVQPTLDPTGRFLYLIDFSGRRIVKLFDPTAAGGSALEPEIERILEFNRRISERPDDPAAFAEKAHYYAEIEAAELARATWKRLLTVDPYHPEANDALAALELAQLKTLAAIQDRRTRRLLDSLGPESARTQFSTTIRSYEEILATDPDDSEIVADKRSLEELFVRRQALPADRARPIRIQAVEIDAIFPSLANAYQSRPVGSVTLSNPLDEPVFDLQARLSIPKYMDYPTETPLIPRLDPDSTTVLDLRVALNDLVFALEEDLRLPAKVEVIYFTGTGEARTEQRVESFPGVTIHRKTALSWDDSGKIASFVVPRESIVEQFAINVVRGLEIDVPGIPERLSRAAAICDAVGAHEITYIEDPDSPFSEIFGKPEVIDTVRFPRDTLQYRIGDCDDTTALLASLLEAVGVRTAIMTSPGHVFLAFDTGEPDSNAWLFETDRFAVIRGNGRTWIPVETTTLSSGFDASWANASSLLHTHQDAIEFLPVAEEQQKYPSMPLPGATFSVVEPPAAEIREQLIRSLGTVSDELYRDAIDTYRARLDAVSGRRATRYLNQIGVLHARFGRYEQAAASFESIIDERPDYTPAYINLSNVLVLTGEYDRAVTLLERGAADNPDSATLAISLARAYYQTGNRRDAAEIYAEVVDQDPDLATQFSFLAGDGDGTARAGIEPDAPLLWESGTEE